MSKTFVRKRRASLRLKPTYLKEFIKKDQAFHNQNPIGYIKSSDGHFRKRMRQKLLPRRKQQYEWRRKKVQPTAEMKKQFWWNQLPKDDPQKKPATTTTTTKPVEPENKKQDDRMRVTVISGFLGSGKTTLLTHLLTNQKGYRIAIIVNDMAELNVDAKFIQSNHVVHKDDTLIPMQNGCICCTLREDLLVEIKKLAESKKYDYCVIESTGISEPIQVAETFTFGELDEKDGKTLDTVAKLDTMVTIVDAENFRKYVKSIETLSEKYGDKKPENDTRSISHLLVDQIEFANVILINKCDVLDGYFSSTEYEALSLSAKSSKRSEKSEVVEITNVCVSLNPEAKVYHTSLCEIELGCIMNTGLFSFERASANKGWLSVLRGEVKSRPETSEYGIISFVYRRRMPFDPMKLHQFISGKMMHGVFRGKGFVWLATRHDTIFDWNQAGEVVDIDDGGVWFGAMTEKEWKQSIFGEEEVSFLENDEDGKKEMFEKEYKKMIEKAKKDFEGKYQDRRQEIVFIGSAKEMDVQELEKNLDFCLVEKSDFLKGPDFWEEQLLDPFEFEDDEDEDEEEDEEKEEDISDLE